MRDRDCPMLAHSGDDELGSRVADRIGNMVKNSNITDWQTVSDMGDKAIAEEIRKLKTPFEGPEFKMEEFQNILRGFDSTFMIAHYYKGEPYIFTADFYPGRFSRRNSTHFSIGCGSPIANFLLDGFDFSNLETTAAAAVLVYVIEEVKKFDPRCGGPTSIFWNTINKHFLYVIEGKPEIPQQPLQQSGTLPDEQIKDFSEDVSELRTTIKGEWTKKLNEIILKLIKKDFVRRCSHERFIRMRHGTVLVNSLTEHMGISLWEQAKSGSEIGKLIIKFNAGLANGMSKPDLESLWDKICRMLPSEAGFSSAGIEFFKLF
jgi:hypothetical protein